MSSPGGIDRIDVRGANALVSGGDGGDMNMTGQNAQVSGGSGIDVITAAAGSTVEGGADRDILYVGHGSTIVFGRGDGQDRVYGYRRSGHAITPDPGAVSGYVRDTTIALRDVSAADELAITDDGAGNLTIAIAGTDDRMTIFGYSDRDNITLSFADGTTVALASLPRQTVTA